MSARAICWRVASLRLLASTPRREVWRCLCQRWDGGNTDEEEEGSESQRVLGPGLEEYAVRYNPAAYWMDQRAAAASCGGEEEVLTKPTLTMPALAVPFRQHRNPYSVRSSRSLSSSQNTLLDLAFSRSESNNDNRRVAPPAESVPAKDSAGYFQPRAFQKCRGDYVAISHDPSQRLPPISPKEASLLLNKVSVLRGSLGPQDVVGFLEKLCRLPPEQQPLVRGHSCFSMLLRYTVESFQLFSDAQLVEVLRAMVSLGLPPAHGMLGLLETELIRRAKNIEARRLLLVADLWRCLNRPVPRFLEQLYSSAVGWCWLDLGLAELVQLIYLMGEGRRSTSKLLLTIELQLLRHLDQLTAEEVGAVCLGLFKSQSSLSSTAVLRLMNRALALLPEMSDFGLVNVLKLLRFSYMDHRGILGALVTEIPRRAPRMGVQGLMHVALACSALHYRDDSVLQAMAERLPDLALQCRSKDAGKLLWAFGSLGFPAVQTPGLYLSLEKALRGREDEFRRFPEHLLTGLLGLAFVGVFPRDLLSLALSQEFVSLAAGSRKLELKKDLFTLDASVGLEVSEWMGPRVGRALEEEATALLWNFAQQDVCLKPEVMEAERLLQELLGGPQFVRKHMILPHTRSIDLEVCLDPEGSPVPLLSEAHLQGTRMGSVTPPVRTRKRGHVSVTITDDLLARMTNIKVSTGTCPAGQPDSTIAASRDKVFSCGSDPPANSAEGVQRLAVQVSNRNQFCYRSHQLLGLHAMKRRQLSLVGCRVVELHYWEWFPLLKRSRAERLAYLRSKIFGHLD